MQTSDFPLGLMTNSVTIEKKKQCINTLMKRDSFNNIGIKMSVKRNTYWCKGFWKFPALDLDFNTFAN